MKSINSDNFSSYLFVTFREKRANKRRYFKKFQLYYVCNATNLEYNPAFHPFLRLDSYTVGHTGGGVGMGGRVRPKGAFFHVKNARCIQNVENCYFGILEGSVLSITQTDAAILVCVFLKKNLEGCANSKQTKVFDCKVDFDGHYFRQPRNVNKT